MTVFVALRFDNETQKYKNAWENFPQTEEELAEARLQALDGLRTIRNTALQTCDWTQLPDVTLTAEQVEAWRVYRQELRDYMSTVTDPFNPPAWPVPPQP